MGLIDIALEKGAFDQPTDPVSSQGQRRFATDIEDHLEDMLNGVQEFNRITFADATELTISGGSLSAPSLQIHTVKSESGTSDFLDTITAANQRWVLLKAKSGHTIALTHAVGNIYIPGGSVVALSGNKAALLVCQLNNWCVIGVTRPFNNVSAISDPGSGDDAAAGYNVGSIWVNTTLDRAWVCVDATAGAAIWKWISPPKNWMGQRASVSSVLAIGCFVGSSTGSGSVSNDATDTFTELLTGSSSGNDAGQTTGATTLRFDHNLIAEWQLKTYSDISNQIIWAGLSSALVNNANALTAGTKFIGFRYSTTKPDAGWRPVLNDGTTQFEGSVIGSVATSTAYKLRIRVDSANTTAYFSVNDGAEVALNTNFPAIATDAHAETRIFTQTGAARRVLFASLKVDW